MFTAPPQGQGVAELVDRGQKLSRRWEMARPASSLRRLMTVLQHGSTDRLEMNRDALYDVLPEGIMRATFHRDSHRLAACGGARG